MSLLKGILSGGSKATQTVRRTLSKPIQFNINAGRNTLAGGIEGSGVTLTPQIGALRDEARNLFSSAISGVRDDIGTLRSLENPFIRARVRPTEERFARLRADTDRGLARRGISGTLRTNEGLRVDQAAQREIADQTALATAESLDSIFQRQGFVASIADQIAGLSNDELRQALAELGLGLNATALSSQSRREIGSTTTKKGSDATKGLGNLARIGFSVAGLFGGPAGAAASAAAGASGMLNPRGGI